MLETEFKAMLTEERFNVLRSMFEWDHVIEQTNSYYADSSMLLKQHGITLRVRTIDGLSRIQVKVHKNADSPLQICEENEFETDAIPESFTAEETENLTGLHVPASLLGSLTTHRYSLMYCDGVEICLDKSDYLGKTDYEIEIEYTGEIPQELKAKLAGAGIEFKAAAVGKMTRFMQRLNDVIHGAE